MIVVLSMNTALDRLVLVPDFAAGAVYRAQRAAYFAGGKALNVARVLRQLDQPVRVVGTLGGSPEPFIRAWCDHFGIQTYWVRTAVESRTCLTVIDPHSASQTVVNEPGPTLSAEEFQRVNDEIDRATRDGDLLCISGSSPPGVPDDFYATLVHRLRERNMAVLVDASGAALGAALEARPWAATPNAQEGAGALGLSDLPGPLVSALAERVEHALVTLGAAGLLYAAGGEVWRISPPSILEINAVGSGDALVAGFITGIMQGISGVEAVRLGVACGASNASRFEPGIGGAAEIDHLSSQVRIDPIDLREDRPLEP